LIWPFLTLYIRRQLDVPLSTVTLLLSVQSIAGLCATSVVGSLMDRFGRKRMMVLALLTYSGALIGMHDANTFGAWAVLIAIYGTSMLSFTVGANAMVADLIEPDKRTGAYALMRTAQNIGVAIGPAIGGVLIGGILISGERFVLPYGLQYYITASVNLLLAGLVAIYVTETLTKRKREVHEESTGGYSRLLRDRAFLSFCGSYVLIEMVNTSVFMLMSIYVKENFGILEDRYGFIVAINALMVIFLQYFVTRITVRYRPLPMLALGALFYAAGALSISLGRGFEAFALSMVIITTGELIVSPTGLALAARLAPPDMRARYMSVYSLTWSVAQGIAPVIGGQLNDRIAPVAMWYGAMVYGLAASAGFYVMGRAGWGTAKPAQDELAPAVAK
jgi:MFS family permease